MLFPKPAKKVKQKRNRERDPEYIKFIHSWPCCVAGCEAWPSQAHHVDKKSRLGSDRSCIPLCAHHHIGGIHTRGEKTCASEWNVNFTDLVQEYNTKYDNGEMGPFYDHLADREYTSS